MSFNVWKLATYLLAITLLVFLGIFIGKITNNQNQTISPNNTSSMLQESNKASGSLSPSSTTRDTKPAVVSSTNSTRTPKSTSTMTQTLFGQKGENYFPLLSKGNQWEYLVEFIAPFTGIQKGKALIRVDGAEIINGKEYSKVVATFSGIPGAKSEISYYRKTKEGIYKIDDKYKNLSEYLDTPFPLVIGKTWTVENPDSEITYRVDSIETAQLFDKKYDNCLKITFKGMINKQTNMPISMKGYSYKAEGIGDVKSSLVTEGMNKVTLDLTLVKYNQL